MACALAILFQVRSLYVPTKDMSPFMGPFLGVPSHLDYTPKSARFILAWKLSVTSTQNTPSPDSGQVKYFINKSVTCTLADTAD